MEVANHKPTTIYTAGSLREEEAQGRPTWEMAPPAEVLSVFRVEGLGLRF